MYLTPKISLTIFMIRKGIGQELELTVCHIMEEKPTVMLKSSNLNHFISFAEKSTEVNLCWANYST